MSGHSKWANIKHRKQAVDAKKGKIFTKVAKEIIVAAKLGGADEASNPRLKTAILKARQVNMPKDNIERAIKKGLGGLDSENYEEAVYEAYGPGGTAFIVEVMTDKKSRTVPEIKNLFSKAGGSLAETGSVSYQFNHKGIIVIESTQNAQNAPNESEDIFDMAIEAGAEDIEQEDDFWIIQTSKEKFHEVMKNLSSTIQQNGENRKIIESGLKYISNSPVAVAGEQKENIIKLVECLEEHDDVQNVYTNLES